jgi:hypothetical protein
MGPANVICCAMARNLPHAADKVGNALAWLFPFQSRLAFAQVECNLRDRSFPRDGRMNNTRHSEVSRWSVDNVHLWCQTQVFGGLRGWVMGTSTAAVVLSLGGRRTCKGRVLDDWSPGLSISSMPCVGILWFAKMGIGSFEVRWLRWDRGGGDHVRIGVRTAGACSSQGILMCRQQFTVERVVCRPSRH